MISITRGKNQAAMDIAGRYPMTHHWDPHDTKLIVCEAKVMASAVEKKEKEEKKRHSLTKAVEEGPVRVGCVWH